MRNIFRLRMALVVLPLLLVAVACGRDDGASVRVISEGTEGSASASASGTGSAASETAPAIDPATADTTVPVTLAEWTVTAESPGAAGGTEAAEATEATEAAAPVEVPAGIIAFEATNGGSIPHEFVVARADSAEALPTSADGSVDETGLPEGALLGEIEPFPIGETMAAAFEMTPGTYVLFCNIADDTGVHFAEGMHTTIVVT